MPTVNMPHDALVKISLKQPIIARDFLQAHLPADLKARIDFDSLELTDAEFVLPRLKRVQSDIIYRCQIDQQLGYIYLLVGHQSTDDELMAFRMLQYQVALMDAHLTAGHKKLPLVLPLCLYHGEKSPYPHSCDITDCFSNKKLAAEYMFLPFRLVDVSAMSDEEITQHGVAALFEMLIKHYRSKKHFNLVKQLVKRQLIQTTLAKINHDSYLEAVLEYILSTGEGGLQQARAIIQVLANALPNNKDTIMTLADQLRQQGMQQGMQRGREEGTQQAMRQVAIAMLQAGESLEQVTRFTGLGLDTLRQLHNTLQ